MTKKNYKINVECTHLNNNRDNKLGSTYVPPKHKPANAS